jgi:glycosyltransferase involved in cell wall biosynthesis
VLVQGRYGHITEIPLDEADVWLYTSGWDGVPSQLLEVAMTGVPMVGTSVGGTGEVMHDGAWPVPLEAGADGYEAAIRAVLADPADARRRALALRARLLRERTLEAYAETAATTLLTGQGGDR